MSLIKRKYFITQILYTVKEGRKGKGSISHEIRSEIREESLF